MKLLLLLLFSLTANADCYKQISLKTGFSQEQITVLLMDCSNQYLIGEQLFLGDSPQQTKIIRKYYPSENMDHVSEVEKVTRLFKFSDCQQATRLLNDFLKKCENKQKERTNAKRH